MDLPEPPPREQATLLLLCLQASKKLPQDIADLAARHVHRNPFDLAFYLSEVAYLVPATQPVNITIERRVRDIPRRTTRAVESAVRELRGLPRTMLQTLWSDKRFIVRGQTLKVVYTHVAKAKDLLRKLQSVKQAFDDGRFVSTERTQHYYDWLHFTSHTLTTLGHCFCFLCNDRILMNWRLMEELTRALQTPPQHAFQFLF